MKSRRDFIKVTAAAAIGTPSLLYGKSDDLGAMLPLRDFGKKGEKVTAIGMGGFHVGASESPKQAQELIECAIERGIRFFDNAVQYQNGLSEEYYGKFLTPKYRDDIFLTTKTHAKTAKEAELEFEDSLRRLKTDRIDLWQMHSLRSPEEVQQRFDDGVLDVFLEKREKNLARYIGFTGHLSQEAHCYFLDFCKKRGIEIDSCLMPVNIADPNYDSFITNVLPKLQEQNVSLLAMKTMVFGRIFERVNEVAPDTLTPRNLHEFVYSLPVASLVSGCTTIREVEENTTILATARPMDEARRMELISAVEGISGKDLEYYKRKI